MANGCVGWNTRIPDELVTRIIESAEHHVHTEHDATVVLTKEDFNSKSKPQVRSAKSLWIPTNEWVAPYIWYYVLLANRSNYRFDITAFDNERVQLVTYNVGDHYIWHWDHNSEMNSSPGTIYCSAGYNLQKELIADMEFSRKLSFSLQLTDDTQYTGGDLEFREYNNTYTAPREKGSLVIFDSRIEHRVTQVKSGTRKSLVGWVIGPRWR